MQASFSGQLKEVGRVVVARPVFLRSAAYKTLNSYHDTAYIYKENYGDSGRGATYSTKSKFFFENLQNTIDKCAII